MGPLKVKSLAKALFIFVSTYWLALGPILSPTQLAPEVNQSNREVEYSYTF